MLSKARTNVPEATGDLTTDEVEKFPTWEVFAKKKEGDAHLYAGSLSAPDASMAQQFAREHYGQDQECISIWVGLRDIFTSTKGEAETYEVFVKWKTGSRQIHVGEVEAGNGAEAKTNCIGQFIGDKSYCNIWTAPVSKLTKIDSVTDMIWRETTDQDYRLAKGYSRVVRKKWDKIRSVQDVNTYQEEDLKETF